jgi:adenylate cyclase
MRDDEGSVGATASLTTPPPRDPNGPGSPRGPVLTLIRRLAALGSIPGDDEDDRLRKGTLILASALITLLAFVWTITYFALGRPRSAAIPLTYQICSVIGLAVFVRTKRFAPYRTSQLLMMAILPCLLQASLGGFVSSSGVALWASFAAVGALMLVGVRRSVPWFAAYLAEIVALGVLDHVFRARVPSLPQPAIATFFVLNLAGVPFTTYVIVRYFVRERERTMAALGIAHRELQHEQERSERLLLNILPRSIARRLKDGHGVIAERYEHVCVLFADVVDFTPLAERVDPEDVVRFLDGLFTAFDALADVHGLEKIKTIGDAYMVAGGLPDPMPDPAGAVARMSLAMLDDLTRLFPRGPTGEPVALRIGIDTGPVVAGVIGRRKFIYDLWGDTVNTASRMESHGVPGGIQVTRRTYELLRGRYAFAHRGPIPVKGKGEMDAYLLLGPAEAADPIHPPARRD